MNTFISSDSIDQLIREWGLRITDVASFKKQNLMIVFLNTETILQLSISSYSLLADATQEQLNNYRLIASGMGIHWPDLDEDLSLKGFLKEELKNLVTGHNRPPLISSFSAAKS